VKIVLDTNVFISGVFFGGAPSRILRGWRDKKIQIVVSESILEEYRLVARRLAREFAGIDLTPFLRLLAVKARVYRVSRLPLHVCEDPENDKFLACALASGSRVIVSGDKKLLKVSGYSGIRVITPRRFVEEYLS
jgi:putative PIN family toxin of toxin-antitoxin system